MGLTVGAYGGRPADRVHVPRKSIGRQQPRALRHVADRPFTEKRVEFAEAPTGMAGDACRDAAAHLANDRLCGGTIDDFSSIILAHATSPFPDLQATLSRAVWHRSGKFNTVSALDSSDAECFGHRARDGLVIRQTRMRSPYLDPLLRSEAWVTWRAGACVHAGPRVHAAWLEPDAQAQGLSVRLFMVLEQVGAPLDAWLANASNTLGPRAEAALGRHLEGLAGAGIFPTDVKPDNVLVRPSSRRADGWETAVIDYGRSASSLAILRESNIGVLDERRRDKSPRYTCRDPRGGSFRQ